MEVGELRRVRRVCVRGRRNSKLQEWTLMKNKEEIRSMQREYFGDLLNLGYYIRKLSR